MSGPRVALRISRTVFSALSGMRLLACLIVAPQQGYDEPGIVSYAIRPFCPISADGLHFNEHEPSAVRPYQDRRLLALVEHARGDFLYALLITGATPLDWHA